jgi:hypothetical protein
MAEEVSAQTRANVVAAISCAWEEGCPVANRADEIASVAIRRWQSSERRGVKGSDSDGRIRDLTKGLISHFEPDPGLVGPLRRDYEYLAGCIADALDRKDAG